MQLTDSEQIKLLNELYNTTRTKVRSVLQEFKNDYLHKELQLILECSTKHQSRARAIKDAIFQGLGVTKSVLDKLLKD